jgi:hypothetical protein
MKKTLGSVSLSLAAILLLGWMLATPLGEINPSQSAPIVADGTNPVPPTPWSA